MSDYSGNIVFGVRSPPASRDRAGWVPGQRIADTSRLFGPYIDVLFDSDFSLQKDPKAYDKMMRDCQIRSCIRLRQMTTAARKVEFLPRDDTPYSKEAALFHTRAWNKVRRPTEVLMNILDAIPRGCSFNEVIWKPQPDLTWLSESIVPVHKDRFRFTLNGEMVLVSPHDIFYGEKVPPKVFMHHKYDPEPTSFEEPEKEGRLYFGYGEFDRIWPWFHFKQLMLRLGFAYVDRLAFPIKVGRYPKRDAQAKAEVLAELPNLDHHRTGAWPSKESGWDIDFLQTSATGHNVAMEWVLYFDQQVMKVLLGSTLMQEPGDKGSFAMSAVHNQSVFGALTEADSVSLCDTLEWNWARWLSDMNNIPPEYSPKVAQASGKSQDLDKLIDTLLLLSDRGYPVSVEQVAELTNLRPAREGETLLGLDLMNPGMGLQVQNGPGQAPFDQYGDRVDGQDIQGVAEGKSPKGQFSFSGVQRSVLSGDILPEKSAKVDDLKGQKTSLYTVAPKSRVKAKLGVRKYATIERCATMSSRVQFTYTNLQGETKVYDVEPYSYRYRRGIVYLYAFDPSDDTIKSFFVHKIKNIKRSRLFTPKWVVEIAESY